MGGCLGLAGNRQGWTQPLDYRNSKLRCHMWDVLLQEMPGKLRVIAQAATVGGRSVAIPAKGAAASGLKHAKTTQRLLCSSILGTSHFLRRGCGIPS